MNTVNKKRILLIEDQTLVLEMLSDTINASNEFCIAAKFDNGTEALRYLDRNDNIDILITDLQLQDIDGFDIIRKCKKMKRNIKTIIISVRKDRLALINAFKLETNSYLHKNIAKEELLLALRRVAEGQNYFPDDLQKEMMLLLSNQGSKDQILSKRETEILRLICNEKSTVEIASDLYITANTVSTHRKNIIRKTGVKNLVGLMKYAVEHAIV